MRVSVCVGEYAQIPYCVPGLEINVYSMEELSYCFKENAFLLDAALLEDRLLEWIDRQCGLQDLAKALHPLVHKRGSLSSFVGMILGYVGFYGEEDIRQVEQVLKQGAGLSRIEKRKRQIDYLVKKKKYVAAIREYDGLIGKWQELEKEGEFIFRSERKDGGYWVLNPAQQRGGLCGDDAIWQGGRVFPGSL